MTRLSCLAMIDARLSYQYTQTYKEYMSDVNFKTTLQIT